MSTKKPEAEFVVDNASGLMGQTPVRQTRSKAGHEKRVNAGIYVLLVLMSVIWLAPFVFLVFQSFRSYLTESGGMVDYLLPKNGWSLDNYAFLFDGSNFFPWWGKTLLVSVALGAVQMALLTLIKKEVSRRDASEGKKQYLFMAVSLLAVFAAAAGICIGMHGAPANILTAVLPALLLYLAAGAIAGRYYLKQDSKLLQSIPGYPRETALDKAKKILGLGALFAAMIAIVMCIIHPMDGSQYLIWYGNTLTIALFVAVIQTVIVLSVSYALSRIRFKGRKLLMNVVLILGMFPGFLTMITLYFLLKQMGLTQEGAVPGLILIYCASSGMGYYISKGFFDTIPKSLDESARIDGATRLQVFYKIIMPLAKPIVIYTILMAFMAPWGDFVFASYVAFGKSNSYNVAVGLYRWVNVNDYQGYFTRFCAGGVLVALPITILFLCLQKYYVEGVTGGAVKG